ncbi:MAG: hypothetical protein CENE_03471 [Candidatus Celerinatantimonas neptuna]|nr:MAG: hypothetical protein CENE_03471 [Candidatus Celerinatantimonas neptuna]
MYHNQIDELDNSYFCNSWHNVSEALEKLSDCETG